LAMQKLFEGIQAFRHLLRWRRNKCCVPGPCASDPVLAFTEFTRTLLTSASLGQENLVNFSYQPQRERKIPPEPAKSVIHRCHICPEGLVLEGLDDISTEAAVRFGWCRHHKTIVSLEII